ncbi:MAG: DUF6279 family lipoprotein [Burkholderiaceae bacterium]|nr:DUF6279 family lipoprotein [Burkholderiaceae bacterium]
MLLFLTGCSSVKLAYSSSPALIQYQLDSYLDLNDAQEATLKEQLQKFKAWHEQNALPVYAQTLKAWRVELKTGKQFTVDDILQKQAVLEEALMAMGAQAAVRLAPVLVTLTPEQRRRLSQEFAEKNAEYQEEQVKVAMTPKGQEERLEEVIDRYKDWLGDLTLAQKQLIKTWLDNRGRMVALWAQERMARQEALLDLIQESQDHGSAERAAQALQAYFVSLSNYRVADIQKLSVERRVQLAQLTASILNSMTLAQRRMLEAKLTDYANDFIELASAN